MRPREPPEPRPLPRDSEYTVCGLSWASRADVNLFCQLYDLGTLLDAKNGLGVTCVREIMERDHQITSARQAITSGWILRNFRCVNILPVGERTRSWRASRSRRPQAQGPGDSRRGCWTTQERPAPYLDSDLNGDGPEALDRHGPAGIRGASCPEVGYQMGAEHLCVGKGLSSGR